MLIVDSMAFYCTDAKIRIKEQKTKNLPGFSLRNFVDSDFMLKFASDMRLRSKL